MCFRNYRTLKEVEACKFDTLYCGDLAEIIGHTSAERKVELYHFDRWGGALVSKQEGSIQGWLWGIFRAATVKLIRPIEGEFRIKFSRAANLVLDSTSSTSTQADFGTYPSRCCRKVQGGLPHEPQATWSGSLWGLPSRNTSEQAEITCLRESHWAG